MPRGDIIRKAIELGRQKGFVTFDELNEIWHELSHRPRPSQDIEAVMAALSDEGINVIEDEGPSSD
jgi:Sigma-70 factor, region 1.1